MSRQFSREYLDRIREAVPVSEIVRQYVDLKRRGREFVGLCPFHAEKTPSFTVNDEKRFGHCFGCGWHGDVIRFVIEHEGQSFPDAVAYLAGLANMGPPGEVDREKAARAQKERDERLRRELEERQRKQDAAAAHVERIMAACEQRPHDYLKAKGFPEELGLVHPRSGHLVIPLRNAAGEVRSAEYITAGRREEVSPGRASPRQLLPAAPGRGPGTGDRVRGLRYRALRPGGSEGSLHAHGSPGVPLIREHG